MMTRSYCCFCGGQLNDREEIVENSVTRKFAHRRCVVNRPAEKRSDKPSVGRCPECGGVVVGEFDQDQGQFFRCDSCGRCFPPEQPAEQEGGL